MQKIESKKYLTVLGFFAVILFSLVSVFAFGAAGDLDPSFGFFGTVVENYSGSIDTQGFDALIQSSGKIVVAGQSRDAAGSQIALARFTSAGVLDSTFGTGGWTVVNFGFSTIYALAAAEQSDGKIVVTGELDDGGQNPANSEHFYVARFTSDGQVDKKFGKNGITVIDFGFDSQSLDVAIAADGKIVIAGLVLKSGADWDWALARVDNKGKIDKLFGSNGIVETDFYGFIDFGLAVAIQPDQKILVSGTAGTAASYGAMGLARYTVTGALDSSFGNGGKVTTDFGTSNNDFGNDIVVQPDGKIVVGGTAQINSPVFMFVRYNTDGTIDLSHLEDLDGSTEAAFGLAIATNGRIILGGSVTLDPNLDFNLFGTSCFDGATGSLDTSFGSFGWAITDLNLPTSGISKVRLQGDNKIVAVGSSVQGNGHAYLALARYFGCGS